MRRFGRWGWIAVLAALVCCGFMAWLMTDRVAGSVSGGAEAALDGIGLGDDVDYIGIEGFDGIGRDGLNVTLEGPASAEEAAVDAVRSRSEVDQVTYRVIGENTAESAEATTDPDAEQVQEPDEAERDNEAETDTAPGLDATTVTATATAVAINLDGTVPDEATRDALITTAVNEYGAANVTHDLVVDAEAVTLSGGTLVLSGEAASDDEQNEWIARSSAVAAAGGLEFVDRSAITSVDQALNNLFTLEPIEFDVNQATIRSRSESTLAAAAELIKANPDAGGLRVVGHTDSDGSAQANQQLSEARAQAVVEYLVSNEGVDAERLEAEGRGESELLVEPEVTPQDKQRNRRIEWETLS